MSATSRLLATGLLALVAVASPVAARRVAPPTIELDGCVLPSDACKPTRDVIEIVVADEKRKFAVEALRFTTSPGGSVGKALSELQLRPLRVEGPKELTARLTPGSHRRVRGMLRLGPSFLLVQAVEPLGDRP